MAKKYDFAGWATKNDVRCADGRIIRKNAFASQDGARVPLFWNHQHNDPEMVLGHAYLFNKEDGVYAEGYFNKSKKAQHVKDSIEHGDLLSLSIYANGLQQNGANVLHGTIRELSVVPGGANPEALIETAMLAHGDIWDDEVAVFEAADSEILKHSSVKDDDEDINEDGADEIEDDTEEEVEEKPKKKAAPKKIKEVKEESEESEGDDSEEDDEDDEVKHSAESGEKTVGDVLKTLNEDQKKAVAVLIDSIQNDEDDEDEEDEEDEEDTEEEESSTMKHNVFDTEMNYGPVLSHSDMQTIFQDWKKFGSLKDTIAHHLEDGGVLAHSVYNHDGDDGAEGTEQKYGIADIDYLFPDARKINNEPEFISRQMDWVKKVMNGVRHTPFSRVKSIFADITMDEARAKGYVKGAKKAEEVFALLKRITTPQTVYKKQKLDRDDILDITDFNVVAWLKAEMRLMLEEECARAILVGDGRSIASPDKISEDHIRPIWKDASLYAVRVQLSNTNDPEAAAKTFIREAIKGRKHYKGSGNLVLFTTADWHTEMMLLEDQMGRPLYDTEEKLRSKLRVSDIVDVEPMEGLSNNGYNLMGIMVDLRDYNVGADKGGEVHMFDDFDIDYNQEKYLMETRFSGALVKPYSAIVVEMAASNSSTTTETTETTES